MGNGMNEEKASECHESLLKGLVRDCRSECDVRIGSISYSKFVRGESGG